MFSGIVENQAQVLDQTQRPGVLILTLSRPVSFTDLKTGDSVAVNGVCLTVENFTATSMTFAIGLETLKITGWATAHLQGHLMNVEQSLKFGDRLHGHLVTGHVDAMGEVIFTEAFGENLTVQIRYPESLHGLIWKKGSVAVNGVSLTVNEVRGLSFSVGLIPETLKRTNLSSLLAGDHVALEVDMLARGLKSWFETRDLSPAGVEL